MHHRTFWTGLLFVLILAACNPQNTSVSTSTSEPTAPPEPTSAPASTSAPEPTSVPANAILSFTNSFGTFSFDTPPTQIIALSEEPADFLITLGIQPIGFGSARIKGAENAQPYDKPHFFPKELLGTPIYVGDINSPSFELMSVLKPELIITTGWAPETHEKLAQIAPLYIIDQTSAGYWQETLQELGGLLGREQEAQEFIEEYDATVKQLAEQMKPVANSMQNILFLYSYAASDGTMILGPEWPGSKPFYELGFTVLSPEQVGLQGNNAVPISIEAVTEIDADIIFVMRINEADGVISEYPIDPLLESMKDTKVIYQHILSTRTSTAPYTDLYVLKEIANLLVEGTK